METAAAGIGDRTAGFLPAPWESSGGIGMHVASMVAQHDLDVESDLAATLPAEDKQEDQKRNDG